ncbi:MAG TPA: efflux RND transporter periplasmic adaptor subunit [Longimicrobiaceae bacterium]|nr:efflux RND transporter periplasmic adaptor subunit [Longimicrobiaceae bacterium]
MHARTLSLAALALALAGCGGDAGANQAAPGAAKGGPGGGPGGPSVTLAASDVASPQRVALEDAIPITGTLEPLERSEVRARTEGDLVGVYVREGEAVRAGQLLALFEEEDQAGERRSADADLAAVRTELGTAQWNLEQTRELFAQGAVPERDVRLAEQQVASARARLTASESRLQSSRRRVGETRVLAPASGVVERRAANPGEHVSRGAALFTLVRGDVLELSAAVPEHRAAGVAAGLPVHFTAGGREFGGRVARVGPSIDPASRAVTVYVRVPNRDGALKAGTFATGRIVARVLDGVLVVPAAALREGREGARPFVYRVVDDKIDVAEVTTGLADEARGVVEIVDGLAEGDRVVVGNVGMLGKGMQVRMAGAGGGREGARPAGGGR